MTITLTNHTQEYTNARNEYAKIARDENATEAQIETAYANMQDSMIASLDKQITDRVNAGIQDKNVMMSRGNNVLTNAEEGFYKDVLSGSSGYQQELILPLTTVDRIFENITREHPLLSQLNIQQSGINTRILRSSRVGAAVWGKVFGVIHSQLNAAFREERVTQSKLTAFVVLPKDLSQFGPAWIESYIRQQIVETFSVALEQGYLNGTGPTNDQPIGLSRDLTAAVNPTTGHAKKAIAGTLTFASSVITVKELSQVLKYLSTDADNVGLDISGKVVMVVNPTDAWDIRALYTFLNANGVYVTVLPFNLTLVESQFQPVGELLAFVNDRYDAYMAGGVNITQYTETLALEDADLFTAKQFAFGKAIDNKAAAIYTLNLANVINPPPVTETP